MAANFQPIFVLTPNLQASRIANANTARDGSGVLTFLFSAGTNGSRVDSITFTSAQSGATTSSAMVGRVFITDTNGANPRLLSEAAIATATASNTAIGATTTITFSNGLFMASGQRLSGTCSVMASANDNMDVVTKGGNY